MSARVMPLTPLNIVLHAFMRAVAQHGLDLAKEAYDLVCGDVDEDHGIDPKDPGSDELRDLAFERANYNDTFAVHFTVAIVGSMPVDRREQASILYRAAYNAIQVCGLGSQLHPDSTFDPEGFVGWTTANIAKRLSDPEHKVIAYLYDHLHPATDLTCTLARLVDALDLDEGTVHEALTTAMRRQLISARVYDDCDGEVMHYFPAFDWWPR